MVMRRGRLLHADGHVGFAHGQVQQAFFQHEVDLEVGKFLVERGQAGGEPERSEADGGGDAQFAEHLLLAVADAGGGGVEALGHGAGGIEQQFALLGQDQAAGVAVEQGGVQPLLQRADLARDGGLTEMQRIARMGQRACRRDRVKDAQFVPIHAAAFQAFDLGAT